MGIWDRLGTVINSYVNDFFDGDTKEKPFQSRVNYSGDPDLNAAYEELDDYLNGKNTGKKQDYRQETSQSTSSAKTKLPPEELREDFDCLGVPFGADDETCKAAYKKLLKIHHPDRHAEHEGNYKKATEKTAKINAAWDRIEKWRNNHG
jgi:DnaJ-domain-containing protein 1